MDLRAEQPTAVVAWPDRAIQHSRDGSDKSKGHSVLGHPVKPGDDGCGWGSVSNDATRWLHPGSTGSALSLPRCALARPVRRLPCRQDGVAMGEGAFHSISI